MSNSFNPDILQLLHKEEHKIATKVYNTEEIELQDGSLVTLRPLPIKPLRRFMKKLEELAEVKSEDDSIGILFDLAVICLERFEPKVAEKGDELEDILDLDTIYRIIEVCGGVKLNDPNLTAAAREMALAQVGQN